jgi:hypothetical protein
MLSSWLSLVLIAAITLAAQAFSQAKVGFSSWFSKKKQEFETLSSQHVEVCATPAFLTLLRYLLLRCLQRSPEHLGLMTTFPFVYSMRPWGTAPQHR